MSERAPGERIEGLSGAYVVRQKHGEGSFGVTYLVDDADSGARYVLKELRMDRLRDWKALELFEREGRTLAALHHPAIPRYRDFFAHDGEKAFEVSALTAYQGSGHLGLLLVQEYVAGQTLAARIERGGPFTAAELGRILHDLLSVLVYLHGLAPPVIHRDITPRNVILDPEGRAHLVDFGAIQDRLRAAGDVGSTTVGTMGFAPLEQMRGDARPASDLYALGMTLLFAASGLGPDAMPVDDATGKVRVDVVARTLSPTLRAVLDAMVEPIVSKRIPSAAEALRRLSQPAAASHAPLPTMSPLRWVLLALPVLGLVVGGAGVALLRAPSNTGATASTARPATTPTTPTTRTPSTTPAKNGGATPAPTPAVTPVKLTWHPRVTEATGLPLAKGARCTLTALVSPGPKIGRVRLVCSDAVLYDSADPLNGTSMLDTDLGEQAASAPGVAGAPGFAGGPSVEAPGGEWRAAWLAYSDVGERAQKAQTRIDTRLGKLQAFRDGLQEYKVTLSVDRLSEPHPGPSLAP